MFNPLINQVVISAIQIIKSKVCIVVITPISKGVILCRCRFTPFTVYHASLKLSRSSYTYSTTKPFP